MDHLDLPERLADLVEKLGAQGIRAGLDPEGLTAPAVLVGVDTLGPSTLGGGMLITARLDLLVPNVPIAQAYRHLSELATKLDAFGVEFVNPVTNQAGQTIGWYSTYELD